jgi:hypothetical protein
MCLCGNISQGPFSYGLHAVVICVSRARSFWLLIDRVWRHEDMLETLPKKIIMSSDFIVDNELTKMSISLLSKPVQGSSAS